MSRRLAPLCRPAGPARRSTSARTASTVRWEFLAAGFLIRNVFRIAAAHQCSSSRSCCHPRSRALSSGCAERGFVGSVGASDDRRRKCPGKDSNLHAFRGRRILSPLRLPFRHPGGLRTCIHSASVGACKKNRACRRASHHAKTRTTKKALLAERLLAGISREITWRRGSRPWRP